MARSISANDFQDHLHEALRDVAAGMVVEVTSHGEVVAVLSPPTPKPTAFRDLKRIKVNLPSETIIGELRGER